MNEPLPNDNQMTMQMVENLADLHISNMKLAEQAKFAVDRTHAQVEALTPELRAIAVDRMDAATAAILAECVALMEARRRGQ